MIKEKIDKIFKKEKKIIDKISKLEEKQERIFEQKSLIAFELYEEFVKNNQDFSDTLEYFKLYIESGYFMVEELIFEKQYDTLIEFRHKSSYRQNQRVNLSFNIKQEDYSSNGVVIDKYQFDKLSENFKINIRA